VCSSDLFKHAYPGERTNLRNFLKSIEPAIPVKNISPAVKGDTGNDDDPSDIESSLAELGL